MFFNLFNYKQKAEVNKEKIIKRDVKKFKKLCLKEFKYNISRGKTITFVDFCSNVNHDFEHEIANIVLAELKQEHKNIDFSFCFRHCENRINGFCEILQIDCDNPQENDPDNYSEETGFPCICGMFEPKKYNKLRR